MMEASKKCAQRPAHPLSRSRASIPGVALDVANDPLLADVGEIAGTRGAHFAQKAPNDWKMGDDEPRRQPATATASAPPGRPADCTASPLAT